MKASAEVPAVPQHETQLFGHPWGLATLYFTEMWERFSFYGMRALLILFMTAGVEKGGLGFSDSKSGAIYGIYTAMVYMVSLPVYLRHHRYIERRNPHTQQFRVKRNQSSNLLADFRGRPLPPGPPLVSRPRVGQRPPLLARQRLLHASPQTL